MPIESPGGAAASPGVATAGQGAYIGTVVAALTGLGTNTAPYPAIGESDLYAYNADGSQDLTHDWILVDGTNGFALNEAGLYLIQTTWWVNTSAATMTAVAATSDIDGPSASIPASSSSFQFTHSGFFDVTTDLSLPRALQFNLSRQAGSGTFTSAQVWAQIVKIATR